MDSTELKKYLEELIVNCQGQNKELLHDELGRAMCLMSTSEFEYVLAFLKEKGLLTAQACERLKSEQQLCNKNLIIFGVPSRLFAETWGIEHLKSIDARFGLSHPEFELESLGQSEMFLEQTRISVRACRAMKNKALGNRYVGALRYNSKTPFSFRFRNLNMEMCDAFVFIGVWVNLITYWVFSAQELSESEYLSTERTSKTIDHFLEINSDTIAEFDKYRVNASNLVDTILKKSRK